MDAKIEAKELIEKFADEIQTSDFHIPEFITGVPCADGSKKYTEILERETNDLAKACAVIAVDLVLKVIDSATLFKNYTKRPLEDHWLKVKEAIIKS